MCELRGACAACAYAPQSTTPKFSAQYRQMLDGAILERQLRELGRYCLLHPASCISASTICQALAVSCTSVCASSSSRFAPRCATSARQIAAFGATKRKGKQERAQEVASGLPLQLLHLLGEPRPGSARYGQKAEQLFRARHVSQRQSGREVVAHCVEQADAACGWD